MSVVTGMNASNRQLSDYCKRQIVVALGQGAADEVERGLETSIGQDQLTDCIFTNPTLTGIVEVGLGSDRVGFFGMLPTGQPAGSGQSAAPPITSHSISYFGIPDAAADPVLGDTGNVTINDQLATVCLHLNDLINDVTTLRTLTNQLRQDLVALGLIKGS